MKYFKDPITSEVFGFSEGQHPDNEALIAISLEEAIELSSGSTTTAPLSYKAARQLAYPSITEQLDMLYHDSKDGTTTWVDSIAAVKLAIPKVAEESVPAVVSLRSAG